MSNQVAVAHEKVEVSTKVYNDYVNYILNNGIATDWLELDRLAAIANDADRELEAARHDALNPQECTCTLLSDACPVCVADNKARYGDEIPFEGSGI